MSLRARLVWAAAGVALVALVAADVATYAALRTFLYHQVRSSLGASQVAIERALAPRTPPSEEPGARPPAGLASGVRGGLAGEAGAAPTPPLRTGGPAGSPSFCGAISALAPGVFAEVRTPGGKVVGTDDCPAVTSGGSQYSPRLEATIRGLRPDAPPGAAAATFTTGSTTAGGPEFLVRVAILRGGARAGDQLVLAQSLDEVESTLRRLALIEVAVTGAGLVVAVLLGWWLVGLGLVPLRRLERTAKAIARGDLTERVPGATARTEVGQVALAMNRMADSIEDAFAERDATEAELRSSEERLRRFVADASHELRTPVAAVSAYAELFERAERSGEDLPRIMRGIAGEAHRMGRLVEDLLLLARLDERRPVARGPVELVDLAAGALETARTVGPSWPVRLEAERAVEVLGDQAQLRQVLDNLLGNIRAHTPEGTPAVVRVGVVGGEALIEVADEGPGLTPEQQERVFERFYRADPSRSRASGGSGLGLSIVASIVEAHGGRVSVASPGQGTVVGVHLPLVLPEAAPADLPASGAPEPAP